MNTMSETPPNTKHIAIVILNWNGVAFLRQFLPSVVAHSQGNGITVYVADNGSTDSSVAFVGEEYPHIQIITFDRNYGFAGGYNKALAMIQADYYVLLNSDVQVTENWIGPVVEFMEKTPEAGACMPTILSHAQPEKFEYAGAAGGYIDRYGYPFCRGRILSHIEQNTGQYEDIQSVFWATGACMFVRAGLFHQLGGFDEYFFAHMEEIDLCWRMKNAGHRLYVIPQVKVYHVGGGTLPNNNPRKLYLNYRNNLFLLYKNLPRQVIWQRIAFRLFLDMISSLIYLASGAFPFFTAVFKAHTDFFRALPRYRAFRKQQPEKSSFQSGFDEIYPRSIVFSFFIRKKKRFSALSFSQNKK